MIKFLKFVIVFAILFVIAGAIMLSSDAAKNNAKKATSELVSSAADNVKAKAVDVADKAAGKVAELADSATTALKEKADSVADGVKSRVNDVRKANDVRMTKRR